MPALDALYADAKVEFMSLVICTMLLKVPACDQILVSLDCAELITKITTTAGKRAGLAFTEWESNG